MKPQEVVNTVQPLLEEALAGMDIEIVDIEFKKEGGRWIFRVYIDHPGGVSHETCRVASETIGDILDREDLIVQQYYLEVSSPGLDRVLKKDSDFVRFAGRKVRVRCRQPVEGQKNFVGVLEGLHNGSVMLKIDEKNVLIPREDITQIRLMVEL